MDRHAEPLFRAPMAPIPSSNEVDALMADLPLTALQEGILFHHLTSERDPYVLTLLIELDHSGLLEPFIGALRTLVDRHQALRTSVHWKDLPQPRQVVHQKATLEVETLTPQSGRSAVEQFLELMEPPVQKMDITRAPVARVQVALDRDTQKAYVLLRVHHLIGDHRSLMLLMSEAVAIGAGNTRSLRPAASYIDFVTQLAQQSDRMGDEAFFRQKLSDVLEPTSPFNVEVKRGEAHWPPSTADISISPEWTTRIRQACRQFDVTAARLFHCVWALFLSLTTGRDDLVFGTVIQSSTRRSPEASPMLGLAVNTLPLRLSLTGLSACEFVRYTSREVSELLLHETTPLSTALRCTSIVGAAPAFGAVLNFRRGSVTDNIQHSPAGDLPGIRLLARHDGWTEYPVVLTVDDQGSTFRLLAHTSPPLDAARVNGYVVSALYALVHALESGDSSPVTALPILPKSERDQVVLQFNKTQAPYPDAATVHGLFEAQAQARPDSVAVVADSCSLTYSELNRKADLVAQSLRTQGLQSGEYVPLIMLRSIEMLVSQLAVLKAGGAYVPVDPGLPTERQAFIVTDCRARMVLTCSAELFECATAPVCSLDVRQLLISAIPERLRDGGFSPVVRSTAAAYVMYTSGSTGTPKGVIVPHRAISRLVINNGYAQIHPEDCFVHYSNPAFDASTFEIWGALLHGAKVIVVPHEVALDARRFSSVLTSHGVSILWMTVGLFNRYADLLKDVLPQLQYLLVGGDRLEPSVVRKVLTGSAPERLLNAYGPTECTTFTTTHLLDMSDDGDAAIPIGRPIANTRVYILDAHLKPVPIGVPGEIYIGGSGVALGYLNQPELTQQRFIPDPFAESPKSSMYRTGDLGRWRSDGAVEFLGRNDQQVKIRGFRVEPGEVEVQILKHEAVKEAAVVAQTDRRGEKRLIAYFVPEASRRSSITGEILESFLKRLLPEYMLPSHFVPLEQLPLTVNGKLDRRALPAPDVEVTAAHEYEAPQGHVEEALALIWRDLLRVERIGRHDNLFQLGGHSLIVVQLLDRLRRLGLSARVRDIFDTRTLADLALTVQTDATAENAVPPVGIPERCTALTPDMLPMITMKAEELAELVKLIPGGPSNVEDIYPLAPLQEGILFHHLYDGRNGDTYVRAILLSVASREQVDQLVSALQGVIDRHPVLRSSVIWEGLARPVQVVHRRAALPVEEIELSALEDGLQQMKARMSPTHGRLDLRQPPLLKLQIAHNPRGTDWFVLIRTHHLVCDNQSLELLLTELVNRLQGLAVPLEAGAPYRAHVWHALAKARSASDEQFFRDKLGTVDVPTAPFGVLDVHTDGSSVLVSQSRLDDSLAGKIRERAKSHGVSPAALMHAAWALVVARTSARADVVFGTVLLGRLTAGLSVQHTMGMFINTLPIRMTLSGVTARDLLNTTHRELVELIAHEQASLAIAQRCSSIPGSSPLFTSLLNYRHISSGLDSRFNRIPGVTLLCVEGRTNYPLLLSVDDFGSGFGLEVEASPQIDPQRVVGYMVTALECLTEALADSPGKPALALSVIPDGELRLLLQEFNSTDSPYPRERTIKQLFENQVQAGPHQPAVVYEDRSLTYLELNQAANRLAHDLHHSGVGPEGIVGICFERGVDMMVAMLAVVKTGAAYLPLDPAHPAERLDFVLRDASPMCVITHPALAKRVSGAKTPIMLLDERVWSDTSRDSSNIDDTGLGLTPDNLAYVIYTSGSTGIPKGVMIRHASVVNHWHALEALYREPRNCRRIALNASITFDASVQQFVQLLSGCTLFVIPEELRRDPHALIDFLNRYRIDGVDCTPSQLSGWISAGLLDSAVPNGRTVLVGGEPIDPALWNRLADASGYTFYNVYGPTECTVDSTAARIQARGIPPHIGRPLRNARIYILNSDLSPVPIGVPGELFIGGAGVARGYLNRPELTQERFIESPFDKDSCGYLYRTGDIGRWSADGRIEYRGRNDEQVKIRGHRIELGEIEARLAQHASVQEVAVLAREDAPGEKRLVAYVTLSAITGDQEALVHQLRGHLKSLLPEYMVPSAFVVLESMPTTGSGKVDRRSLPAPELSAFSTKQYEAPQDEVEGLLAGIWARLLNVERVGRHDNFFELGGHSLLIVQMMEQMRRVGLSAEVRRVFESPSLAELANALTRGSESTVLVPPNLIAEDCETITSEMLPLIELDSVQIHHIVDQVPGGARNVKDIYPLAPLQEGILFHHLIQQHSGDVYLMPTLLALSSRDRLEELIAAIQGVIDRHDALRTAILWEGLPRPVQIVYRNARLPVKEVSLSPNLDEAQQLQDWIRPGRHRLDLTRAPMVRLQVAPAQHGDEWYALILLHHIACDHVTAEAMISEVVATLEGRTDALPDPTPYRNHVAQTLANARTHDAGAFFRRKLAGIHESTTPFGLVEVLGDHGRVKVARMPVDSELARRVRVQARACAVSVATLFHAVWAVVVSRTSGRDDVVFGTVLLGRLHGRAGAQRTLGMFINTLPLRLRLRGLDPKQLVEQTQRELIELLTYEQASLAEAQRASEISGTAPLFSALLNFRHSAPTSDNDWDRAAGIRIVEALGWTNYPLTLSVDDLGEGFSLTVDVDRELDPQRIANYVHTALESLVSALERSATSPASTLRILPETERGQILESFNATQAEFPQHVLIHELFEEQVKKTPRAAALAQGDEVLTYDQVNRQANKLARYFVNLGIGPNDLVAICLNRSPAMIVALLAVLKSGGAYVSLDPAYPEERLAYLLQDAQPAAVLAENATKDILPGTSALVLIAEQCTSELEALAEDNLSRALTGLRADHLAYVIYTSGSTGLPKGVAIEHRNTVNLIYWAQRSLPRDVFERTLHSTSLNFDLSVYECFVPLSSGGCVEVVDNAMTLVAQPSGATLINSVPSAVAGILDSGRIPETTRAINLAGEVLKRELVERIFLQSTVSRVTNLYGPSETTTYSTWVGMRRETGFDSSIGHPIANTQIYILDQHREPVPIAVAGEIYIGGRGVARGYLRRPELTAERFISDPFGGGRMYKTGDLARWTDQGTIEYLGRVDHQVKIRGHRIEMGEIEAQIARHEQVKEAVVIANDDSSGDKRLVAYVVGRRKQPPQTTVAIESSSEKFRSEVVSGWEALYEETYTSPISHNPSPTFVGWNSSYTGQPIPEPQMQEWLLGTVQRIKALGAKRVLEIGCGVGLVLQHVAPTCDTYIGTDFSGTALRQLGAWIDGRKDLSHVTLLQRTATELHDLNDKSFDAIVVNSVVQYFPDIEYLLMVLTHAIRLVADGGSIFLGDIRHLGLLPMFHSSVQVQRAAATVKVGRLRGRLARAIGQEKELLIDPEFFRALPQHLPSVTSVDIQLKRGVVPNELSCYRYDVLLKVNEKHPVETVCAEVNWQQRIGSIELLKRDLLDHVWPGVTLTGIPNGRLARESAAYRLVEGGDPALEAHELRRQISEMELRDMVDPESLWRLGDACGYDVTVTWAEADAPTFLRATFIDRARATEVRKTAAAKSISVLKNLQEYANDPTENAIRQQLVPELREFLTGRLPDYMIPSAWVVLRELPLTPNGKIDRRALPVPSSRPEELGEYVEPSSSTERTIAEIWAQLLRIDQVGVNDNFFDLGGHSLLAIRMLSKVNVHFGTTLGVADIYGAPTVHALSQRLEGRSGTDSFIDLRTEAVLDARIQVHTGLVQDPPQQLLITGCTGFVGRFLLAQLLENSQATVYCLIRSRSVQHAQRRLRDILAECDLWREDYEQRIVAVRGDLALPRLGLDATTHQMLCNRVDSIYHCGTSMNHLESYPMAKPANVEGLVELLHLATTGKPKLLNYISTLGVFNLSEHERDDVIDEDSPIDFERHLASSGYLGSKWVGEKIVMLASQRGIACNIFRLGLVWADRQQGRYDPLQWVYRLIKSCLLTGFAIKDYRFDLPPTPVDYVASAILSLAARHPSGKGIFHISSTTQSGTGLFEHCNETAGVSLELLRYTEWISRMKRLHKDGRTLPITPLIEQLATHDRTTGAAESPPPTSSRRVSCQKTQAALGEAGLIAPCFDSPLIGTFLTHLLRADSEIRRQTAQDELISHSSALKSANARRAKRQ